MSLLYFTLPLLLVLLAMVICSQLQQRVLVSPSAFPELIPAFIQFQYLTKSSPDFTNQTYVYNNGELLWGRCGVRSTAQTKLVEKIVQHSGLNVINKSDLDTKTVKSATIGLWCRKSAKSMIRGIKRNEYPKYNRLPGMNLICDKTSLNRIIKTFVQEHDNLKSEFKELILPSFEVPAELDKIQAEFTANSGSLWIVKPALSSRSRGIGLVNSWNSLSVFISNSKENKFLVQKYVVNPYLRFNRKVEFRAHLLITSIYPIIRASVYFRGKLRLGQANFTTEESSWGNPCVFSRPSNPQKCDPLMEVPDFEEFLAEEFDTDKQRLIRERVIRIIQFTLLVSADTFLDHRNTLKSQYSCFHLLGLDFVLDQDAMPWLMEINSNPIRSVNNNPEMCTDTLNLAGFHAPQHASERQGSPFGNGVYRFDRTKSKFLEHHFSEIRLKKSEGDDNILKEMTAGDLDQLILLEEERNRAGKFERVFPFQGMWKYFENGVKLESDYYYQLFVLWERINANATSEQRISLLRKLRGVN